MSAAGQLPSNMRVAIVHDWLVGGGAERVVDALHELFPDAPIYTSYCTDEWRQKLDNKVVTGYLQKWPFSKLRKFLPVLRFRWFASLDLSGFDLVISSSGNGEAMSVKTRGSTKHVSYCHTPTHFYWRHYDEYMAHPGFGPLNPLARVGLKLLVGPLRRKDYRAAQNPELILANSSHIQQDIRTYYGRESVVVFPPVDVERFQDTNNQTPAGYVTVGRQVPLKRIDILVEACTRLDLPLTVVGKGPEHGKLVSMAGPTVTFLDNADDDEVAQALTNSQAFLKPAFEDFGIAPVEALAAGTPVIAYKAGGALDYITPATGLFFTEQTTIAVMDAVERFNAKKYSSGDIKSFAQQFSKKDFQKNFLSTISAILQ